MWCGIASYTGDAQSTDWQIIPSTCVNDKPSEPCRVEITVTFPENLQKTSETACFYIEDTLLNCLNSGKEFATLPVELTKSSTLEIRINNEPVAKKQLTVQSMAPNNKRRRVRNPWSFF